MAESLNGCSFGDKMGMRLREDEDIDGLGETKGTGDGPGRMIMTLNLYREAVVVVGLPGTRTIVGSGRMEDYDHSRMFKFLVNPGDMWGMTAGGGVMAYFGDEEQDPREHVVLPFGEKEWSRNLEHAVITMDTLDAEGVCWDSSTPEGKWYKEHPDHALWNTVPGLEHVTLAPPPLPGAVRFGTKPEPSDWQKSANLAKIKLGHGLGLQQPGKDASRFIKTAVDRAKGTVTFPFSTATGEKLTFRVRETDQRVLALRAAWSDQLRNFTRVSVNIRVGQLSPSRHFFDWMCLNQDVLRIPGQQSGMRPVQTKIQAVGWTEAARKARPTEVKRTAWVKLLAGYLGHVCPWGRYCRAGTIKERDAIGQAWDSLCGVFSQEAQQAVAGGKRPREEGGGGGGGASSKRNR